MGIGYNPKIVTKDLVLYLDAANKKSYPGSGNTWLDLSGKTVATLNNGPTFDGNAIVFDGALQRVTLNKTYLNIMPNFAQQHTLSCWVNILSSTPSTDDLIFGGLGYNNGILVQNNRIFKFDNWYNNSITPTKATAIGTTIPTVGIWYNVVGVFDKQTSNTMKLYVNGILESTVDISAFSDWRNNLMFIGGTTGISETYATIPAKITACAAYNRALTAAEVKQNFNTLRGRFGV
jgi:hypothetical protein